MKLQLVVIQGPDYGRTFDLQAEKIHLIGRFRNSVSLNDTAVSRIHAELSVQDGRWQISDAFSTNGTFVNGHRISGKTALHEGDQLQIGQTKMMVKLSSPTGKRFGHLPPQPHANHQASTRRVKVGRLDSDPGDESPRPEQPHTSRPKITPLSYYRKDEHPNAIKRFFHGAFRPLSLALVAITGLGKVAVAANLYHNGKV